MAVKGSAHVPKFGEWESSGGTPFTMVFENARKQKGEKFAIINPNDPAFFLNGGGGGGGAGRADKITIINPNNPAASRGSGGKNVLQPLNPPKVPRDNNSNHGARQESPLHAKAAGGVSPNDRSQKSAGSLRNSKPPPLVPEPVGDRSSHRPHFQRGSYVSPGKAPPTPVHLNMVQAPTVPKFGDWKDQPASVADKYTEIFESIRNEKNGSTPHGGNASRNNIPSSTTIHQKSIWLFTCCFGPK